MKKILLVVVFLMSLMRFSAKAQFTDCTTGLMQMASAEMEDTGVLMITNNFLNKAATPQKWYYNTFGYGFSITFWSRLEVAYVLTIFDEKHHPYPGQSYRSSILFNQDRHFAAKVLALKEGEIWKWTPSIAVGISDPITGTGGDYLDDNVSSTGNGYFNRVYIVAAKHFATPWGEVGGQLGYQYSRRTDYDRNGPIAAATWRPVWLENRWFNPKFILEYDAYKVNFGFIASVWDDRFEAMFDLQGFQWISFGLRFKLRLAGTK